jgi:hypothetical protein
LVRELGNEFATFLAEPVTRANEGFVDWYTESTQPAVPAVDLAEADRDKLEDRLIVMRHRVFALADKIEAPGRRDADKRFADAIRRAMIVPSDDRFVWSLAGQPTLLLWGMQNVDDETPIQELLAAAINPRGRRVPPVKAEPEAGPPIEPPAPPPTPEPPPRRFPFALPLWLLFAALVGAIYYLLFVYCDIAIGPRMTLLQQFGINACTSTFATTDGALRRQQLQDRIEHAELDLARVQGDCEPPQPPYVRPPTPTPTPSPSPTNRPRAEDICEAMEARGVTCRRDAKLQIALGWKGPDDIDLHVDCPGGTLSLSNTTGCGGEHYLDTVTPTRGRDSIENADWTNPPRGHYRIKVHLYTKRSQGEVPFTILIRCGDNPPREVPGRLLRNKEMATIAELDYPACQ